MMSIAESITTLSESLLTEFLREAKTTKKFLERLPNEKLGWQPHEKSMTAGQLALHIASVPGMVCQMAQADVVELPEMGLNPQPASVQEILKAFDESVAFVSSTLPTFSDDRMRATWQIMQDGNAIVSMPRADVCRTILLNHWYHHRGQFGVYLRMIGAIVPSSYGPSGDEMPDFS